MAVNTGAFLEDPWTFDSSFFNISPREARSMDPQQRIILTTTQAALDDAGYVADSTPTFQRESIGCYMGIATGDYVDNLKNDIDVYYSPGMREIANYLLSNLTMLILSRNAPGFSQWEGFLYV